MARRKKKKKNQGSPKAAPDGNAKNDAKAKPGKSKAPEVAAGIQKLHDAAVVDAIDDDLHELEKRPKPAPDASPEELVEKGNEALSLLEIQRDRATEAEDLASNLERELAEARKELEAEQARVREHEDDLKARAEEMATAQGALEEAKRSMAEREETLLKRELDADAGFLDRNRDALAELEKAADEMREEFSTHRKRIFTEREAWESEIQEKRSALEQELSQGRESFDEGLKQQQTDWEAEIEERQRELDERDNALSTEASRLRKEAQNIAVDREFVEEDRQAISAKAERIAAAEIEQRDAKIASLEERLDAARKERDEVSSVLGEREEADTRFGNKSTDEVLRELRALKSERTKLKKALGERPDTDALQRLEELTAERDTWQSERLQMLEEAGRIRQELQARRIAVTELEGLRNHKAALEASNELLTKALEDGIQKVNDLVRGADGASPFPSCSKMDGDTTLQSSRPTQDKIRSLKDFAEYVRYRMAHDPETGKTLYYSQEDVRSFIAGLAMSRLHLLQGISGTGKTSLPLAFARAIGAGHGLIEIQAGWRDRQDLVGHFNTFESRFYESEFLQALYRAGCPHYKDTPFIIVLDEMNLSHPEQYFADLLSTLEQDRHRQKLVLMTAACDPAPKLLVDGKALPIPPNVWFIGTANHDETTKDFADKTYDRAHVMELPRHRDVFEIHEKPPSPPVAFSAVENAFQAAKDKHEINAAKAYKFLEEKLAEPLGRRFSVGWGNRMERQMQDYVPVVIECGGSIGEATDHVLASKLLRKIRDRHDNRPENIIALRERIVTEWPTLDKARGAEKSLRILQDELHRLGHDQG